MLVLLPTKQRGVPPCRALLYANLCAEKDEWAFVLCSCVTCMPGASGVAGDHHARAAETMEQRGGATMQGIAICQLMRRHSCARVHEAIFFWPPCQIRALHIFCFH